MVYCKRKPVGGAHIWILLEEYNNYKFPLHLQLHKSLEISSLKKILDHKGGYHQYDFGGVIFIIWCWLFFFKHRSGTRPFRKGSNQCYEGLKYCITFQDSFLCLQRNTGRQMSGRPDSALPRALLTVKPIQSGWKCNYPEDNNPVRISSHTSVLCPDLTLFRQIGHWKC